MELNELIKERLLSDIHTLLHNYTNGPLKDQIGFNVSFAIYQEMQNTFNLTHLNNIPNALPNWRI